MAQVLMPIAAVGAGVVWVMKKLKARKSKRRKDATEIQNLEELAACVEDATHFLFERAVGTYDHHFLVGDVRRAQFPKADVAEEIQFDIFEFVGPEGRKSKKNADIYSRRVILQKSAKGDWTIIEQYPVEADSLQHNINKGNLFWVDKPSYPQTAELRRAAVQRAKETLGSMQGQYRLTKNNCEHFVTACLSEDGVGFSVQANTLRAFDNFNPM